jgi:sugar O-acyltransferase (sialic acid O-acetyltransferase NeuD family)
MTKSNLLVFGSGGHACSVLDAIDSDGRFTVVGLIDSFQKRSGTILGYAVLGSELDLPTVCTAHDVNQIVIAIGDNYSRLVVKRKIQKIWPKIQYPSIIHKSAIISPKSKIGEGTLIMAGSIINSNSTIGDFCIINTNTVIEHDCTLESYVSVGPSACVGGKVTLKKRAAVMLGTSVVHGVTVGQDSVIGAGSVVLNDIEPNVVSVGIPSKPVKIRSKRDKYL